MNEYYIGKREQISWGEESSYGTPVTPTAVVGLNTRIEPDRSHNWNEILSAGSDTRSPDGEALGPKSVNFRLVFTPVDWSFLKYAFNESTTGSGPYTHSLSVPNTLNSFTLEWARRGTSNNVVTFSGCVIKNFTVNFERPTGGGEGMISITAEVLAQDWSKGSSVTSLSSVSKTPFQYRHTKVTIDGVEVTEVPSGSMNIDQGVSDEDSRYANATLDRLIGQPIPKVFRVSGSYMINVKDDTFETLFSNATTVSNCKLEFIKGVDDKVEFVFSNFRFKPTDSTNLEGVSALEMAWNVRTISSATVTDSISSW